MSHLTWMLGTKLRSTARKASALNLKSTSGPLHSSYHGVYTHALGSQFYAIVPFSLTTRCECIGLPNLGPSSPSTVYENSSLWPHFTANHSKAGFCLFKWYHLNADRNNYTKVFQLGLRTWHFPASCPLVSKHVSFHRCAYMLSMDMVWHRCSFFHFPSKQ